MASATTSDTEIVLALRAKKQHGTYLKAGVALGIAETTVKQRCYLAESRGLTVDSPVRDPLEKLREELRRTKAELRNVHKHNDTAEEIRKRIYELKDVPAEPPGWLLKDAGIAGPGTPMTIWSDWHFGEVVRKEEVGGVNEFNSEIAEKRVKILVERTLGLIGHHMPAGVPGVVVCLGGDMMTGDIHQELADTNDKYVLETVRQLKSVLYEALVKMADACGKVFVPCVVGNHGRNTLKPRMKGIVQTSYEWNIYTDLEDRLRNDKRIKFFIPGESDAFFSVVGHKFLLTHGDRLGVKGGDGIIGAFGPIMRGSLKVGRSEAQIGRNFDTIVMGHWHQYVTTPGIIVNNALKGYDEYARSMLRAPASAASQALWFVHERYGINTAMEVFVQDPRPFRASRDGKKSAWVEVFDKTKG